MDIEALVRAFNNLPRSPKVPSGLVDNHWQFGVHHVPLTPPGDLLYLINPGSRYGHSEGPAQILSLPSAAARAEILVPLLLKSFVDALVTQADPYPPVSAYAPWSWGTGNEELAKALEERLKAVGVRKELCKIKIGDDASCAIEEEGWSTLLHELIEMTGSEAKKTIAASNTAQNQHQDICANCKKAPTDSVKVLRFCGACKSVRYCSRDCQKVHWKKHKKDCKHNTISASQGSSVDPIEYYRTVAANMPEAQKLAREIGLIFAPPPNGKPHSLSYPIRRLVITGKDTPENITTLLGPNDKDFISRIHKDIRLEVLLRPPKGSPMYAETAIQKLDENCPPWSPRKASAAEEEDVRKIKDMQERILRYMGSRSMGSITSQDVSKILVQSFGRGWDDALPIYQNAINAMDQGVRAD